MRSRIGAVAAAIVMLAAWPATPASATPSPSPTIEAGTALEPAPLDWAGLSKDDLNAKLSARLGTSTAPAAVVARRPAALRQAKVGTMLEQPTPTTVEQEQALADKAVDYGQTYVTDSAHVRPISAASKDYTNFNECTSKGETTQPAGFHKNHWAWCKSTPWYIASFDDKHNVVGDGYFMTTLVGFGHSGTRTITIEDYITEVTYAGSWPAGGATLTARLPCTGAPTAKQCSVSGAVTFKIPAEVNKVANFTLTSATAGSKGKDLVSTAVFKPRYTVGSGPGSTTEGFEQGFRCDSAAYLGSKGACIFDRVTARFQLRRNDKAVAGAAAHVWLVFHSPSKVYPGKNKAIPSRLRREHNATVIAKNRSVALAACKKHWKTKPAGKDCDEYPFASTRQGASLAKGAYSVRYVNSAENQAAGRRLGSWFQSDRILDNNVFVAEAR